MTITGVAWSEAGYHGRDIHLLPGLSGPALDQMLKFTGTEGSVTTTFSTNFEVDEDDVGVGIDEHGVITVADPLPAPSPGMPRLRSFIVDAQVRDGDQEFHAHIRFHIHDTMTSMWLTPSPLTVRVDTTDIRFSVLGLFDDGVIGDITNWAPWAVIGSGEDLWVHHTGDPDPVHQWAVTNPDPSTQPGITVDNDTGQLSCLNATATNVSVTVTRSTDGMTATGLARGGPAWTTPVRLAHVMGAGYDAMARPEINNVLFLPDGFLASERNEYERLVQGIVTAMRFRHETSPYDVLGKSLNFFTAWVPSNEAGHSVQYEVFQQASTADGFSADIVPIPDEPADTGTPPLSLRQLIWTVGLPLPGLDHPGDALADDVHDWDALFDGPDTSQVSATIFTRWLRLSTRVLLNECDTAFGLCSGERPMVDAVNDPGTISFHPLRGMSDDLDGFLRALQNEDGNAVTDVWSAGNADQRNIIFLCRIMVNSGSNIYRPGIHAARYIGIPLFDDKFVPIKASDTNGWNLIIAPPPNPMPTDLWATAAHELAHSFTLGDEYGEGATIPDDEVPGIAAYPNLQARNDLLIDDTLRVKAPDGTPPIPGIKWAWPRIAKAGVLAAAVVDSGGIGVGPFTFTLQPGHGAPFAVHDVINVRTRPLGLSTMSDRLSVTSITGDVIVAELVAASTFVETAWPAGSVVLVAVRADPVGDNVLGDDLLLVAQSTIDRIEATHNPLNMDDGAAPNLVSQISLAVPTAATNFPNNVAPQPPPWSSWYVGLFDNGGHYNSGVYRPTGICLMAKPDFVDDATKTVRAYQFCPVCRYALVDRIDPTKHGVIDAEYAKRYPA